VLGLLQGEQMWIEPTGFSDVHARGNHEPHRLQRPDKWTPYGVGPIEGQTRRAELPVLAPGPAPEDGADGSDYGPGEEPRPRDGEPTAAAHGELL
jgi:hypothetical protein